MTPSKSKAAGLQETDGSSRTDQVARLAIAIRSDNQLMNALPETLPVWPTIHLRSIPQRVVLAWAVMIVGLVGFWCCRPFLGTRAFNYGQLAVLGMTWKIASLLCLPPRAWARFTPLRFLAYCVWIGVQPRQFLVGERTAANAPIPTVSGFVLNVVTGLGVVLARAANSACRDSLGDPFLDRACGLLFPVPDRAVRFLGARLPRDGLRGREALGLPDRRDVARRFLGQALEPYRPGFFAGGYFPARRRRAGAKVALVAVFLYSGMYHECVSFMARSGYGGPTLYFLLQCLGVAIENSRPARRLFRGRLWLARVWTFAVVVLPVGLFLHPGIVDGYLVPMLVAGGVPGLER